MTTRPVAGAIALLHDPDRDVRGRAAIALGQECEPEALAPLLDALCTEPDAFVRENITWSVVRWNAEAIAPLVRYLADSRPLVRHNAVHALGKIGGSEVVEPMIGVLGDDDDAVLGKAIFSLGQIGDVRAVGPLARLVGHESREIEAALATALSGFGTASVAPLIEMTRSDNSRSRAQSADILRLIGDRSAVPAIAAMTGDPVADVRLAVANALRELGGADALAALAAMAGDTDTRVRSMARRAPVILKPTARRVVP